MIRTRDISITNAALYQLSYKGVLLFNTNKFGHTKICFSTVDHNANGSLSRTKWLAFTGFFMGSSNAFTVLKFLVPSEVSDIAFPCHGACTTTVTHTTTCIRWSPHRLPKLISTRLLHYWRKR